MSDDGDCCFPVTGYTKPAMTDHAQVETVEQLRARVAELEREFVNKDQIIASLADQLAASQARCREMEKEIGSPNETGTYAWDRKERIRMKRVIDDFCIAEGKLQATLAAREARIHDLERGLAAVLQVLQPFTEAQQARGSSGGAANHGAGT